MSDGPETWVGNIRRAAEKCGKCGKCGSVADRRRPVSMQVDVSINYGRIHRLIVTNETGCATGENTYHWTCADLATDQQEVLSIRDGRVMHVMEDGALALVAKVAQAADSSRRIGGTDE